jgi:hypothetical protein
MVCREKTYGALNDSSSVALPKKLAQKKRMSGAVSHEE